MSTPIGHSLLGIALTRVAVKTLAAPRWRWYVFGIVAANAPDLDFLPGIFQGDINIFHQGPTHSILAVLLFGALSAIVLSKWLRCRPLFVAGTGILFYASHLVLDYFRVDGREPFGIPLLWPFSNQHWISSMQLFHGIQHGVPGDNLSVFLSQLFSRPNLIAVGVEIIILLPVTLIAFLATSRK
jgi:membrane-bound metal-dependent hydrolase YbcI (DUF457 family)